MLLGWLAQQDACNDTLAMIDSIAKHFSSNVNGLPVTGVPEMFQGCALQYHAKQIAECHAQTCINMQD